jgi:NAD(P)-dependent dehydrogenase (short-subunit alcohol dehydrogenase family)
MQRGEQAMEAGMLLQGRTVLVTGAAAGIGGAIADACSAHGARVIAVDLNKDGLASRFEGTPDVVTVEADLSTDRGIEAVLQHASSVDVLCNNAGIIDRLAPINEVEESEWERLIAVNLTAPFRLCRGIAGEMATRGEGVILNIASVAGMRGGRAGVAYTVSKWGLVGMSLNIAATMGGRVRCNVICPGGVDTGLMGSVELTDAAKWILTRDRDIPSPATPEQIASVALFLASDAASRINGAVLPVDGGATAY